MSGSEASCRPPPCFSIVFWSPRCWGHLGARGPKGIGEAGTIGSTPAVVNAAIDALSPFGIRHLDMPLTPSKIWGAVTGQPAAEHTA